ncbi:hypothetical protein [Magnetospirillum molischianum]|uniref:Uncharacterized protein n=1 Tax=Magnetospirillum molischianum DSM 120 TaxID=1150626 RepID=H8FRU6_MAGML|nr:hypothetical protein [Magnetospirillum molischianum]CCG41084.1 hypothetical protein PHAMO_230076 [Magnetospirillum molischianum DSM 120]
MRLGKDFDAAIARELRAAGVDDYKVERGGKHPRLVFGHAGRQFSYTLPGSPSDHRALLNMVHDLRGLLGLNLPRPPVPLPPDPPLDLGLIAIARQRVEANPPSLPTEKDLRLYELLDSVFEEVASLARRAQAADPAAWTHTHLERLERLVALGLAESDVAGRYRRLS